MRVIVNGEQAEIGDNSSVADLLDSLGIGRERVAVEVNLDIVPKAHHDTHLLCDGDKIEVVHFVGGG